MVGPTIVEEKKRTIYYGRFYPAYFNYPRKSSQVSYQSPFDCDGIAKKTVSLFRKTWKTGRQFFLFSVQLFSVTTQIWHSLQWKQFFFFFI